MTAQAVPLMKTDVAIVKSPRLPIVRRVEYRHFDDFIAMSETLAWRYDLVTDKGKKLTPKDRATYLPMIESFFADMRTFDRDDFYRRTKERRNAIGELTSREIKRRHVSEQVAALIGSFPNAAPASPEFYIGLMIEDIIAMNASPIVLETTCREIRRKEEWLPSHAKLIEVLHLNMRLWAARLRRIRDLQARLEAVE